MSSLPTETLEQPDAALPERPIDQPVEPPASPPVAAFTSPSHGYFSHGYFSHGHLWLLLAMTLLGGVIRFGTITHPPIWGDEASTFGRVCGPYRDLLDILQYDGFAPLHYELYWCIQHLPLSGQAVNAFLPALAALLLLLFYLVVSQGVRGRWLRLGIAVVPAAASWVLLQHVLLTGATGRWGMFADQFVHWAPLWTGLLLAASALYVGCALWGLGGGLFAGAVAGGTLALAVYALLDVTLMTPPVLRFVPALCGTLMIPAVYFLAVQMVSRRAALLAALFTALSAYMMVYSHDAKMYPAHWLFCTLCGGCVIWWLRTNRLVAWLAWIACGLAASGLHVWGLLPVALGGFFLLSRLRLLRGVAHLRRLGRRRDIAWFIPLLMTRRLKRAARQICFFLLGAAIVGVGAYGFYRGFNRMIENLDDRAMGLPSAVSWVDEYNTGRTGPDLVLFAATAHLYSWEWPGGESFGYIPPARLQWLEASGVVFLLLLGVGLLPWLPWRRRSIPGEGKLLGGLVHDARPREPGWRRSFWLTIWIVFPCYGFYCFSVREFASPLVWIVAIGDLFQQHWGFIAIEWLTLAIAFELWPIAARFAAAAVLVAAAGIFNVLLIHAGWEYAPAWREFFSPHAWVGGLAEMLHYHWLVGAALVVEAGIVACACLIGRKPVRIFAIVGLAVALLLLDIGWLDDGLAAFGNALWIAGTGWMDFACETRVLAALIGLAAPLLWYFSGRTIPRRARQTGQFVGVVAACLAICVGLYAGMQYYWGREVTHLMEHHEDVPQWDEYVHRAAADHGVPTNQGAMERVLADRPRMEPQTAGRQAGELIDAAQKKWDLLMAQALADHGVPSLTQAERRVRDDSESTPDPPVLHRRAEGLIASAQHSWDELIASGKAHGGAEPAEHYAAEQVAGRRVAAEELTWQRKWRSGWMPRYIGLVWPAVAIALSCLLLRLPTRGLRWGAIVFVLALNVTQSSARLYAGNEPPVDRLAADIMAGQAQTYEGKPTHSLTRTYLEHGLDSAARLGGHPGTMQLNSGSMVYELAVSGARQPTAHEFRDKRGSISIYSQIMGVRLNIIDGPGALLADLQRYPQTQRVIYWDVLPAPRPGVDPAAHAQTLAMGPRWELAQEQFVGRMHWVWQDLYVLRRREYVRRAGGS